MDLKKHINKNHGGNASAFAKSAGTTYQQVQRWIKLDCIWHDGDVWQRKTKLTQNKLDDKS
jgi:hypothetical protein